MKLNFFKNWDEKLLAVLCRFPVSIVIAVVYAVLAMWSVHSATYELGDNLIAFFVTCFFLSVAVALALEGQPRRVLSLMATVAIAGLWWIYWQLQPSKFEGEWLYFLSAMALIAFVLAVFFGSYYRKEETLPFWNFTVNTVIKAAIAALFAGVLMGGLSLAFAAVDVLFKAHLDHNVYQYLAIVCFLLFFPVYFLSNVLSGDEKNDRTIRFNAFLKIFSLHIVLPILLIYTVILYVYLVKIVVEWQLPNGWVSWLVSVLGVGGFLTIMLVHPVYLKNENRLAILFCRFFPLLLLPLLVLMTVGVFRRFNDYGLTINRLLVIILNAWMYAVAIWLLLTRSKGIRMVFVSFAVIAFLSAVGPWSVFALTRHSITNHLEWTFAKYHMLKNGKVDVTTQNAVRLDSATYERLSSALYYLNRTFGAKSVQPFFTDSLKSFSFYDTMTKLGKKYGNTRKETEDLSVYADSRPFTTEGFQNAISFNLTPVDSVPMQDKSGSLFLRNNALKLHSNKQVIVIPLVNEARKYRALDQEDKTFNTDMTTVKGKGYKLVIRRLSAVFRSDTVISTVEGVLLY